MDRRTFLRGLVAGGGALGKTASIMAQSGDAMNPPPRLTLDAAIAEGKLRFNYVVENLGATDLYLRRALSDLYRVFEPGVEFAAADKLVTVYRVPPREVSPDAPVAVLVKLLRAGERFREDIELDLPLREYNWTSACRETPNTYRGMRFSIEYIWHIPGVRMEHIKVGDVEWDSPIFPLGRQLPSGTLISEIIPLDIPVIECAET